MRYGQHLLGLRARVAAVGLVIALAAGMVQAAEVVDNFDFGATGGNLKGFGATGDGWSGAWDGAGQNDYVVGANLTYSATGYSNGDNTGTTGVAGGGAGWGPSTTRAFTGPVADGTLWLSFLSSGSGSANGNNRHAMTLNSTGTTGNRIEFAADDNGSLDVTVRLDGATASLGKVAGLTTHLVLVRIDLDSAGDDDMKVWINPDLSGGESGLAGADFSDSGNLADATGFGFIAVNIDGRDDFVNYLDAIRISSESDGYSFVTLVPEPASLALIAMASVGFLVRRDRIRRR